jgi:hypothetical protein
MAGNDVFLYVVPSDADSDDVRLRDPSAASTPNFVLAATEAADAFSASVQDSFQLAAIEASDVVAAAVVGGLTLAMAATEAADTLAADVTLQAIGLVLAATEASDTVAADVSAAVSADFVLAASEGQDTAAADVTAVVTSQFFGMSGPSPEVLRRRVEHAERAVAEAIASKELAAAAKINVAREKWQGSEAARDTARALDAATRNLRAVRADLLAAQTSLAMTLAEQMAAELAEEDDDEDSLFLLAA